MSVTTGPPIIHIVAGLSAASPAFIGLTPCECCQAIPTAIKPPTKLPTVDRLQEVERGQPQAPATSSVRVQAPDRTGASAFFLTTVACRRGR